MGFPFVGAHIGSIDHLYDFLIIKGHCWRLCLYLWKLHRIERIMGGKTCGHGPLHKRANANQTPVNRGACKTSLKKMVPVNLKVITLNVGRMRDRNISRAKKVEKEF